MTGRFHRLIYPTPDPAFPFLGVHLTKSITGEVFVGPTAVPAFGRENYGILKGVDLAEAPAIVSHLMQLIFQKGNGFSQMMASEVSHYRPSKFLESIQALAPCIEARHLSPSSKVGIRAQLVRMRDKRFEMDFVIENGPSSTHVLNAVSPGFTSSFAFAQLVVNQIVQQ